FFQAEDGIRDYKVTGVQTCALPISRWPQATRPEWGPLVCASGHPRRELCQTAGAGATLAGGAGAPRHQVTAITSETRSWPSMKTRKRTPGNSAPTATTDSWLTIEYIPMSANQTVIQRGTPPCDNATEAITRKPIAYSHWPAP